MGELSLYAALTFFCSLFGSSALTNSGGVVSDMFNAQERALALSLFAVAPFLGTLSPGSTSCNYLSPLADELLPSQDLYLFVLASIVPSFAWADLFPLRRARCWEALSASIPHGKPCSGSRERLAPLWDCWAASFPRRVSSLCDELSASVR